MGLPEGVELLYEELVPRNVAFDAAPRGDVERLFRSHASSRKSEEVLVLSFQSNQCGVKAAVAQRECDDVDGNRHSGQGFCLGAALRSLVDSRRPLGCPAHENSSILFRDRSAPIRTSSSSSMG